MRKRHFENILGKGENAGDQHFLLYPQYFLSCPKQISNVESFILSSANALNLDQSKSVLFGKELTLPPKTLVFACLQYRSFENTLENGEIADNKQFPLFLQ